MKHNDLDFILNVLQRRSESEISNVDWYYVLGFLELNKISGYFYNACKDLKLDLPQNVERRLSQTLKLQHCRNKVMQRYIEEINETLKNENIEFVFLKGSVLSNANFNADNKRNSERIAFYESGERTSNDIDILIKQQDITLVSNALKGLGFKQGFYNFSQNKVEELTRHEILSRRMNRGETAPFILKIDNDVVPFIEIDVNFSLSYLPSGNENMLNEILREAKNYYGNIRSGIKSLSVQDFFLHLIMHQYKESVLYSMIERNKDMELYKILDIYLFIVREELDVIALKHKIKKFSLEKEVYCVLNSIKETFKNNIISDFLKKLDLKKSASTVVDPQNSKEYAWINNLEERLTEFNKLRFLKEVKHD